MVEENYCCALPGCQGQVHIYHRQYNVTYLAESTTFHVGVYSILVLYIVLGMYMIDQVYNTVGMIYKY